MRWTTLGAIASLVVHGGLVIGVASIPKNAAKKNSLIAVVDKKKKPKPEDDPAKVDEPPPPPKPIEAPKPAPRKAAVENTPAPPQAPAPAAVAAHPALAALPNLGISMAGGPGGGGIAVPVGPPGGDPGAPAPQAEAPKVAAKPKDDCTEEAVKPKLVGAIAQDRIIAAAQAAGGIEGKIRLELQVDETGNVTSVRVTAGLGGAIDDAALSAARRAKVKPATRCGRAVAGRLVVAMTIRNPD